MAIFWSETAEVEMLDMGPREFIEAIIEDPDETISLGLYSECLKKHGPLPTRSHFVLRVESALGGEMNVGNIVPGPALAHMRALGKLAQQLRRVLLGTRFTAVRAGD